MYGKTKPDFTVEHGEGRPACPLNSSQCVPMGCSCSNKASKPSPFDMQWGLAEELSLQRNFQILVWAETLGSRGRKDYTIEEVSSQYPLEDTTKGAWECQAAECQGLATSYSKKHFRMKSKNTEVAYSFFEEQSPCPVGPKVTVYFTLNFRAFKTGKYLVYIYTLKLRI